MDYTQEGKQMICFPGNSKKNFKKFIKQDKTGEYLAPHQPVI
jgi:hypothetical protein